MFLKLNHQKLDVYKGSRAFVLDCYRLSKELTSDEKFGMVSQVRRAAISVHLNITEGASRKSAAERKCFFEISRGSIIEIDAALDIADDLDYMKKENSRLTIDKKMTIKEHSPLTIHDMKTLIKRSSLILAFGIIASACAQSASKAPGSYVAHKTNETITIDGKADEKSWSEAKWSQDFIDIEGVKTPTYKTNMKMLWDDEYLYFYAKLEEPHVWGTLKQRDTVIFYNNDFEIFIDPDGDTHNYMEFEMNALNTVWDLYLVKPYREHAPVIDSWDIQGLKTAVHINGTLNDPNDKDSGWSVEIAMPWKVLTEANSHGNVPVDEFWRVNFSRVNWDFELVDGRYQRKKDENGKYLPEYNWVWSPQGVINMHEPEHWGYVYFSSKEIGQKDSFSIPQDERIKWQLYALYRKQKSYQNENGKWAASLDDLTTGNIEVEGEEIIPVLEVHKEGWSIEVVSPFTNDVLIITEDGKFLKRKG